MGLKLSVLDQSVAASDVPHGQVISQTVGLAQFAQALGYERFWVSEHHSHPSIVGTAPEILMAAIAAKTDRIRIGSAGVMLPHYASLKVAEQFRVLNELAPGRIDLGVGRAPGSDQRTAHLLNPDRYASERFGQQIMELKAWLSGQTMPQGHPGHGVFAYPQSNSKPEIWILGSSDYGAQLAAHLGLAYAYAHFITDGLGLEQALELYRQHYKPSKDQPSPKPLVCVWALCANTEEEAHFQFASRARWKLDRQLGRIGPMLRPEDAMATFTDTEKTQVKALASKAFIGEPAQVASKLNDFASRLDLDELVLITWAHDHQVQRNSYALLAKQMGLRGAQSVT
jgi:luciferase family oxidoreductase group 1